MKKTIFKISGNFFQEIILFKIPITFSVLQISEDL